MKEKPGVMIYFDIRPTIERLSDRDAGLLFRAILAYSQDGTVPDLPNRLALVWPLVQMRLDADTKQYEKKVVKRRYAAYVRWAKRHEEQPMSFEDWMGRHGYDEESKSDELQFQVMQIFANDACE